MGLLAGLISNRTWISEVTLCLLFGAAIGPLLNYVAKSELFGNDQYRTLQEVARITLGIAVMGTALRLPFSFLRRYWRDLAVVLMIGLVLMWLTGAAFAALFLGVGVLPALLIGAIVAPTDPVVAASIVSSRVADEKVPAPLRHLISAESAANDGLGLLFVMLPILLLTKSPDVAIKDWLVHVLIWEVAGAILIGGAIGWAAGKLFVWAKKKPYSEDESLLTIGVALSLTVLAGLELLGSDGILAVFVAGLMFNRGISEIETRQHHLHGAITRFFDLPVFVLIGVLLPWSGWMDLGWRGVALALALVALKRLPWWLLLKPWIASLKRREEALFAGWFGPIGVAAAYYALLGQRDTGLHDLWTIASLVIFVSVILHGVSATPLSQRLGARLASEAKQQ
ncbi:cation:proton antiporter [Erythrobacter sp. LQ02-29]|uniref:cation:proton antiporter n=1 Tax=Erythrobacter sp. LQ02-29 TaxID=2920384 RepID=UPI001F4D64C9|nr:cation:proton antiporter [Erythrobacter sp. LQ02-29]MCP9221567.1 cation:proton antiporter [Erythrobacter sp. LQ02-29]